MVWMGCLKNGSDCHREKHHGKLGNPGGGWSSEAAVSVSDSPAVPIRNIHRCERI
jgi:hypothetical protein